MLMAAGQDRDIRLSLDGIALFTDIDAVRYPELVMKLVDRKGTVTRKDVIELLHVSPSQAYRILHKLEQKHQLVKEGTTRSVIYKKA